MTRTPAPGATPAGATPDPPLPVDRWRLLFAWGVGLSLLLVLLAALLGWRENQQRQAQAVSRTHLVAEGIARQVQDRLQVLAGELAMLATAHAAVAPATQSPAAMRTGFGALSEVIYLDGDGRAFAPDPASPGHPVLPARADDGSDDGLQLLVPEPGSGTLPVVWNGVDGLRIAARIDPQWFIEPLHGRSVEPGSVISLVHDSRRVYVRSHDNAAMSGKALPESLLFSPANLALERGFYETTSVLDGVEKQLVFRRITGTPLSVVVGNPLHPIVAPAWGFLAVSIVIALLLALLWMALLRAYVAVNDRQAHLLARLRDSSVRLQRAQTMASIGTWRWHVVTGEVNWSEEVLHIHGRDPSQGPLTVPIALGYIHPEDIDRMRALFKSLITADSMAETEFRILRSDGSVRWIQAHAESAEDADGRLLQGVQQDITELAEARDRLRRAERQYRFLFEDNPLPMWVFDRESLQFLATNEAMRKHYGYSEQDLLQVSVLDIRPATERALVEAVARHVAEERPQGEVWTHLRKDGSRIRMAIFTHDIDFDGQPARLVAAQDVTDSEVDAQRFRLIARATNDAVWDLDLQTDTLWWGDSFYSTFGHDRAVLPPTLEAWAALVHPHDHDRVADSLAAAAQGADTDEWQEHYRFRHRDGSYREVIDRGFLLRDADGIATRMLGGMCDVTTERLAEQRMRLLSRAVEATANGVIIVDARQHDLPIVYANPAFERMTGYTAEECIGRNCRFLQGDDRDQVGLEGIRYALSEESDAWVLLRNYRKDGTLFWNECYVGPVFDETGVLTHFVGAQNDVSDHHHYQQELAYRATHDVLTGLPNRQLLLDRLQMAVLDAESGGRAVAVIFIDLDDFKLVNDSLDHSAGDEALRLIAQRMRQLVSGSDIAARFGGDEFVIVSTEHTDEAGLGALVARIGADLSRPITVAGVEHVLTTSIGWCRYPDAGHDAETLLKHADIAMYEAKRQGRNRSVGYSQDLNAKVSQRLQLIAQLREALDKQQFVLAFQPIYDREGRVQALECLARWQHPQRGLLPPSEFIKVCEESGLIVELGRRTLHEAARHHALLAAAGFGHVRLAVNVSAMQFGHALDDDVAAVMARHALPPGVLELELTESVIMENADRAIDTMHRIAGLGVCLSVDDFGTGYSSLAYLKRLPIDRLKIDRSFVMDLPNDRDAASICSSIIGLAHSLGLRTVGEGVETQAQWHWLTAHGCDEMQGYLMARPAPFEQILKLLQEVGSSTPG